jgi:ADP-ribosylglycohydrolase
VDGWLPRRELPPPIWSYTDDSAQAAVLVRHLVQNGRVVQDALAVELAEEHHRDPRRGYGAGASAVLGQVDRTRDRV